MKINTKAIFISAFSLAGLLIAESCTDPDDLVTSDAKEGGGIVSTVGSSGKVLGVPDATTGEVTFTDNILSFKVTPISGGETVESYAVVKQLNGGTEVIVEEFDELPHTVSLSTLAEFIAGTGKDAEDLRIGDTFLFRVKQILKNGREVYSAPVNGAYSVVVNCSSNLAGSYSFSGLWSRAETGNTDVPFSQSDEVITEVSPGVYSTTYSGHYSHTAIDNPCPFVFSDVCGVLTIAPQYLCDAYSNEVVGSGTVDAATGNLHFEYTIDFAAGKRHYTVTYVKN